MAIVRRMKGLDPLGCPACLVAGHAPFCWGKTRDGRRPQRRDRGGTGGHGLADRDHQSRTRGRFPQALRDKHHFRKHGPSATYGQN